MKTIRAKFSVWGVVKDTEYNTERVELHAVYGNSDEDNEENNQFSEATPVGDLHMTISNPSAQGFFEQGKEYYLDFTEAINK